MITINDVAERAGVSVATVSRALANKPHVRPEVRDAVLRVVEEIGYRRNRTASSLRKQTANLVGLSVSDIRNPFFTAIARAIEDVALSQEMSVFFCNTDESKDKERLYLQTLLDENVAGIIFSPTQSSLEPYDYLLNSGTPVVVIDRRIDGANVDCVLSNNLEMAYSLTSHLIENGYRRIGAVFGLRNSTTGRERMQGYLMALADHGIAPDPHLSTYVYPREAEGEEVVGGWLQSDLHPDAILTGNSRLTIGALNAFAKAGISAPKDIALAGFDETVWAPYVSNGLTVISQPTYEMGKTAAELLFQRIADPTRAPREVILKGELIKRGSTVQS